MENRYVAIVDIPGGFMQADVAGTVYVNLVGALAELLVKDANAHAHAHHHILFNGASKFHKASFPFLTNKVVSNKKR